MSTTGFEKNAKTLDFIGLEAHCIVKKTICKNVIKIVLFFALFFVIESDKIKKIKR